MSEVKRFFVPRLQMWDSADQPPALQTECTVVLESDFDRVTAERDALQQRLTAADERVVALEGVLRRIKNADAIYPGSRLMVAIDAALKPAEGGGDEQ